MIRGIEAYKEKLKAMPGRITEALADTLFAVGKAYVDEAVAGGELQHDTGINTTAQDNSYVCAVYYNGKLVRGPHVPKGTDEVGVDWEGHDYINMGAEGRQWAMEWGTAGFQASGRAKGRGFELMIANCAWYTPILEDGTYKPNGRKWEVIVQVWRIFKKNAFLQAKQALETRGLNIKDWPHSAFRL